MSNSIAKKFTFLSLIRFALPSIIMMVFMSLYTIVDGIFVSRFVGTAALSAVNVTYPFASAIVSVAVMFATGGSAVVARQMGEGQAQAARANFTAIVIAATAAGALLGGVGLLFTDPLVRVLGADDSLAGLCREYLWILSAFAPASVLQILFQNFFVTAGRPGLGLLSTVVAGAANAVLDYVFIVPMQMGIGGAALATGIGYTIPAAVGVIWFLCRRGTLYFSRPVFRLSILLESCANGSSEMVTNLSASVTTFLFNIVMMRLLGVDGVAAMTIVLYAQFLMTSLYMGYSIGVAPVISYNYGSADTAHLKKLFWICIRFIGACSLAVVASSLLLAPWLSAVFAPKGSAVYALAVHGFVLFSFNYLFAGTNIFASALFTALSNGKVSAAISFLRTFLFIVGGILLLPHLWGVDGVWLAVPVAEALSMAVSVWFLVRKRSVYHYA